MLGLFVQNEASNGHQISPLSVRRMIHFSLFLKSFKSLNLSRVRQNRFYPKKESEEIVIDQGNNNNEAYIPKSQDYVSELRHAYIYDSEDKDKKNIEKEMQSLAGISQ